MGEEGPQCWLPMLVINVRPFVAAAALALYCSTAHSISIPHSQCSLRPPPPEQGSFQRRWSQLRLERSAVNEAPRCVEISLPRLSAILPVLQPTRSAWHSTFPTLSGLPRCSPFTAF